MTRGHASGPNSRAGRATTPGSSSSKAPPWFGLTSKRGELVPDDLTIRIWKKGVDGLIAAVLMVLIGVTGVRGVAGVLGVAGVVCCAAGIAGDMMQDLKVGHVLGGTPWRMEVGEIIGVIDLIFETYRAFGFEDFMIELSTKPLKHIGSDEIWDTATNTLSPGAIRLCSCIMDLTFASRGCSHSKSTPTPLISLFLPGCPRHSSLSQPAGFLFHHP